LLGQANSTKGYAVAAQFVEAPFLREIGKLSAPTTDIDDQPCSLRKNGMADTQVIEAGFLAPADDLYIHPCTPVGLIKKKSRVCCLTHSTGSDYSVAINIKLLDQLMVFLQNINGPLYRALPKDSLTGQPFPNSAGSQRGKNRFNPPSLQISDQ
jgi:hypothetical protein